MMAVTGAGSPHVGHGMVTAVVVADAAPAVALTAAAASSPVGAVAVTLTVTGPIAGAMSATLGGIAPRQL